jgi:hypothetical protein
MIVDTSRHTTEENISKILKRIVIWVNKIIFSIYNVYVINK